MASSSKDKQLTSIAPGPGPLREYRPLTKNKKSSSACLPCKQAKRKCSGRPAPCKACEATNGNCVFNEHADLRRKIAAQKAQGDLERYQRLLWDLLEYLRTANEARVHHILEGIRAGGDVEGNVTQIIHEAFAEGSPSEDMAVDASDTDSEHNRQHKDSRISVQKLCDSPLFRVPCQPWTNVTVDDHLVSGLVSLYFTWDHPIMQVVDQELFLRDMIAGDMSSEFCSPVLVNSILAIASAYSPYPEVYCVPGDVTSRGRHFFEEAEVRQKAEEGRPTLANIQALTLMSHSVRLQGKDNVAWLFLRQAVQLGQDIGLFELPRSGHNGWDRLPDHMRHASARTAWSIFILNSQLSMELRRTANLETPRVPLDKITDHGRDMPWIPYHSRSSDAGHFSKPALLGDVMAGLAKLTEIIVEIQDVFFDKALEFNLSIDDLWKEANRLNRRLEAFLDSLASSEIPLIPQVLFLHIRCHHVTITLFDLLSEQRNFEESLRPSTIEEIRSARVRAALQVAHHLHIYREHFEMLQMPCLMYWSARTSALTLFPFIGDETVRLAFDELYGFLVSFSRRFPAAKAAKCEVDGALRDLGTALPFENRRESEYS